MKYIYISYSTHDREYYDQLMQHLAPLELYHGVKIFNDKDVLPGEDWQERIQSFIEQSDVFLVLVSANYLASDYCSYELSSLISQSNESTKRIIPIILRACDWQSTLGKYFALPSNAVPIMSEKWLTTDDAYNNISTELQRLIFDYKGIPDIKPRNGSKKIYLSYSLKDSKYRNILYQHLLPLEKRGLITIWDDRKLLPGDDWDKEILNNISNADVYVALVSSDYLSSNYITQRELSEIRQQVLKYGKPLIPVLLKASNYKATPLNEYQPLPIDGSFIVKNEDNDEYIINEIFMLVAIDIVLAALKQTNGDILFEIEDEIQKLEEFKKNSKSGLLVSPQPKSLIPNKKVFISYNHKDKDIANKLKIDLEKNNIEVVIDQKLLGGADIKRFIEESVYNTDYTVSIISVNSLFSSWVAMESINTLYQEKGGKANKFIGCFIDNMFFDRNFPDKVIDFLDSELKEITDLIPKRLDRNAGIADLESEFKRLRDFKHNIDSIIDRLRGSNCLDISSSVYDTNLEKLLNSINS